MIIGPSRKPDQKSWKRPTLSYNRHLACNNYSRSKGGQQKTRTGWKRKPDPSDIFEPNRFSVRPTNLYIDLSAPASFCESI